MYTLKLKNSGRFIADAVTCDGKYITAECPDYTVRALLSDVELFCLTSIAEHAIFDYWTDDDIAYNKRMEEESL